MIHSDSIIDIIFDTFLFMKHNNYHTILIDFNNQTSNSINNYFNRLFNDNHFNNLLLLHKNNQFILFYDNLYIHLYFQEYISSVIELQIDLFLNLNQAISFFNHF